MTKPIILNSLQLSKPSQLTPEEETKLSWAKRVMTYNEVPEEYRFFFDPLEHADQSLPYTVTTPSYEGFLHRYQEKLICFNENELILLNKNDAEKVFRYPLDGFSCIEFSKVLLDADLRLHATDQDGKPAFISLHFNTASDEVFKPVMQTLRQHFFSSVAELDKPDLSELEKENYKFASYCRNYLLPGEKVLELVWEAEMRENRFTFALPEFLDKIVNRIVFPNHVTLLTDQELIFIHENPEEKRRKKYGGYWEFVPLKKVKSASLTTNEKELLCLTVTLMGGVIFESLYRSTQRTGLEEMINQIKKRI